jgi:hypothetical protein
MDSPPDFNKVRIFLAEKVKSARSQSITGGIGILAVGIVLCGISYVIAWYVLKYGLQPFWPHPVWLQAIFAGCIVAILFLGNTIGGTDDLLEFKLVLNPGDEGVLFYVPNTGLLSETADTPYGFLNAITNVLCIGPKTVASSFRNFRRAERMKHLELNGCAAVITVLLGHDSKVPFNKIVASIEGLDPYRTFPQMGDIHGVLFLKKEPQGMSLTSEFREEYASWAKSS